MLLSPDNESTLYSARNLLLHDFRVVLGCSILKANVDLKFKRIPFVKPTISEAKTAVLVNKKSNANYFQPDFNQWFRNVGDNGVYDLFYRYLNQKCHFGDHTSNDDSMDLHALV